MDESTDGLYSFPDDPSWIAEVCEGSWLRFKEMDSLNEINRRVHPKWKIDKHILECSGLKVQVNRRASYHGGMNLITVFGVMGYLLPAYFELEQANADPIDYEWSGKITKISLGSS